jgi:hypothetical protein
MPPHQIKPTGLQQLLLPQCLQLCPHNQLWGYPGMGAGWQVMLLIFFTEGLLVYGHYLPASLEPGESFRAAVAAAAAAAAAAAGRRLLLLLLRRWMLVQRRGWRWLLLL